ncbi:MAG: DNA-binding protein, partial [Bacteroidetes bacterium]|nr:DNA-binding protein [Bacteroidota bacterium]
IRNGYPYIILTREDGIVFKIVENKIKADKKLMLHSLNSLYDPYDLDIIEVKEVWKFVHYISSEMPQPNQEKQDFVATVKQLRKEVHAIQTQLNI